MKPNTGMHINTDKVAGLAATLILHIVVLYGLWRYNVIPPPSEALTVFVSYINPASPAKIAAPAAPAPIQPAPVKQEIPKTVTPFAPQVLTSPAPLTSPVEPVAPAPVARVLPAPVRTSVSLTANVPATHSGGATATQPVLMNGELSVSCTERTAPAYPKQSLRLGEQGKTVLLVELDELGRVVSVNVKTKSGYTRLDEAAINAVKTWRCSPAKRNGAAVRSVALQPFNFVLKGR